MLLILLDNVSFLLEGPGPSTAPNSVVSTLVFVAYSQTPEHSSKEQSDLLQNPLKLCLLPGTVTILSW